MMRTVLAALTALVTIVSAATMLPAASAQTAQSPEYRAQWVNAFNKNYDDAAGVTAMIDTLRAARSNVVIPEVRVYSDAWFETHPAFYPDLGRGTILAGGQPLEVDLGSQPEPRGGGGFDALGEILRQAHDTSDGKQRLDVWAWLVSFRSGATMRANHPDWLTLNADPSVSTSDFDPGHPGVEQQLVNVCMDLVSNTDVDGLNFDYIRFIDAANGYNPVSIARFNARYRRTGTPADTDPLWQQWRRDQVTNVVRKIYLKSIAARPGIRISADTITWAPSPSRPRASDPNPLATWKASFEGTSGAYKSTYQDWRGWMEEGILDISVPMTYFRTCTHDATYDEWSDFAKENQFGRQTVIGPGTYLNTLDDALDQLRRTRDPSRPGGALGAGQSIYAYAAPYALTCGGTYLNDPAGMAAALTNGTPAQPTPLYPATAALPPLPRLSNGKGHLMGTVSMQGAPPPGWIDGAAVLLKGPVSQTIRSDGTGFYGFVDVPPGDYTMTVRAAGAAAQSVPVHITAQEVATADVVMAPGSTADEVAFSLQPGNALAGATFGRQPVVLVQSMAGETMTGFNGPVTLSIQPGTGAAGATLGGTTTVNAVSGVATFTDLSIDKAGSGYVLVAASGDLTAAASAPFDVVPPAVPGAPYIRLAALPNASGGAVWGISGFDVNANPASPYYGYAYVTDRSAGQNRVRILRPVPASDGARAVQYEDAGWTIPMDTTYLTPWDVSVGPDDTVWIASLGAKRIYTAAPAPPPGMPDIPAIQQFDLPWFGFSDGPRGLTVAGPVTAAKLYVACTSSSAAHVFSISAPSASEFGFTDPRWSAPLGFGTGPYGVAVDKDGNSYWPRSMGQGSTGSVLLKFGPSGEALSFDAPAPAWLSSGTAFSLQDAAFAPDPTAPGGGSLYYSAVVKVNGTSKLAVLRFGLDGAWLDGFGPAVPEAPPQYAAIDILPSTLSTVAYLSADDAGNVYVLGMSAGANAVIKVARAAVTPADLVRALRAAGGLGHLTGSDRIRLDAVSGPPSGVIDLSDALRIARKLAGLDPNP